MLVRELITRWGFEVDDAALQRMDTQIGEARDKAADLGANLRDLSRTAVDVGQNLTQWVTLPLGLVAGGMLKLSGDAESMQIKFDRVFRGMTETMEEWATATSKAMGRSRIQLKEQAAQVQGILVPMGFARDQAAGMSRQMVELSQNLAAVENIDPARAINAMTSAMVGEFEAAKRFGVVINQERVNAEALRMGLADTKDEITQVAEAQAALNLIMQASSDVQGAAANRNKILNGAVRDLWASIKDTGAAFGDIMNPAVTAMIQKVDAFVEWLRELDETTKTVLLSIGAFAAMIGPLIATLGLVGLAAMGLRAGLMFLAAAWRAMSVAALIAQAKMLILPLIITSLIALFALLAEDIYRFVKGQRSLTGELVGMWDDAWAGMKLAARNAWENIKDFYGALWSWLKNKTQQAGRELRDTFLGALDSFFSYLDRWREKIKDKIVGALWEVVSQAKRVANYLPFVDFDVGGQSRGGGVRTDATGGPRPNDLPRGVGGVINRNEMRGAQTVQNSIEVPITLPPGSTEEQGRFAQEAAQIGVEEALNRMLRRGLMAFPQVEG